MRKFLLAAVAAAAIASPAAARDGSGYVGVDLGAMLAEDTKLDFEDDATFINNAVSTDYKTGYDIGLVGGYDFGLIRAEVDLAYKNAGVNEVVLGDLGGQACPTVSSCIIDADGDGSVLSAMANLILDFGDNDGLNGFVGAGVGMSRVSIDTDFNGTFPTIPDTNFGFDDEDSAAAWQLIAGFRVPVSQNIDAGVKYRFFNTRELEFSDGVERLSGHWRSHSLLASLT
jgi:OmpA-OmpF porin, OOP family